MATVLRSTTNSSRPAQPPPAKRPRANGALSPSTTPARSTPQQVTHQPPSRPMHGRSNDEEQDDSDTDKQTEEPQQNVEIGRKRKMSWADTVSLREHPLSRPSRHYGRTVEAYESMHDVFQFGTWFRHQLELGKTAEELDLSDHDELWLEQFEQFEKAYTTAAACASKAQKKMNPSARAAQLPLSHWLAEGGVAACAAQARISRKDARGEDAKEAKDWLPLYQNWTPALHGLPKTDRGFRHPQIRKLITPLYDQEKIEQDPQLLEDYIHHRRGLHPDVYLPFMYYNNCIHPNPWKGFLRGDLLVKVGKLTLTGPASLVPRAGPSGKSKASQNGMTEMTLPAIAWITTLTLFALSGDDKFHASTTGPGIHYITFYKRLMLTLENAEEERRDELLKWWNKKLFRGQGRTAIVLPEGVATTVEEMGMQPIEADEFAYDDDDE